MKRVNLIMSYLVICVATYISFFVSGYARERAFFIVFGFLSLFLLMNLFSHQKKEVYDLHLFCSLIIIYVGSFLIFRSLDQITLMVRVSAIVAFTLLNFVLLIGPWSRFSKWVRKKYYFRRHMGVSVFLIIMVHISLVIPHYFQNSIETIFSSTFTFFGVSALFLLFWLAITSWDYLQVHFRPIHWKTLHGILLAIYFGMFYYSYTLLKALNTKGLTMHLILISSFLIFWIIAAPYSIINKILKTWVFGWKQTHVLIYVIYGSLIIHVYSGVVQFSTLFVKIAFWVPFGFVVSSHSIGWIIKLVQQSRMKRSEVVVIEDKNYVKLGALEEFEDSKGKKFSVEGKEIAVFKIKDKFHAISNACCHQKGPIYQGKVSCGTVECPWHYWVYNLNDGKYLGKDKKFSLSTYEVIVQKGNVFVNPQEKTKGHPRKCN